MNNKFILCFIAFFAITTTHAFPQGRCYVNACDTTPYHINRIPDTNCFDITLKSCNDPSKYQCCQGFHNGLHKIVLQTRSYCDKSVKQVSVNGVNKAGGLFFVTDDKNDSEFRITSLRLNNVTAPNTRICLTLDPTNSRCNTWEKFCPSPCLVSTFDPFSHNCCATCQMKDDGESSSQNQPPHPPPKIANYKPPPSPSISKPPPPLSHNFIDIKQIKATLKDMTIQQLYMWIYSE